METPAHLIVGENDGNMGDSSITLSPLGGGADDFPQFQAAQATHKDTHLAPGSYSFQTTGSLASNGDVHMGPGVTITQALPPASGSPLDSALLCNGTSGLKASTLANTPALGATVLHVTLNPNPALYFVAGDYIQVVETVYRACMFKVLAVANGADQALRIDRPVRNAIVSTNVVGDILPVRNVHIYGNGARITGAGSRFVEFIRSIDCSFENLTLDCAGGTPSERLWSIDMSCYNCRSKGIRGDGGGTVPIGGSFESSEFCSIDDCEVTRCTVGIVLQDAINDRVSGSRALACGVGMSLIGADVGSGLGCSDCQIIGGSYSSSTTQGILVQDGSDRNRFSDLDVLCNVTGILFTGGTEMRGNIVKGCNIRGNTSRAIDCSGLSVDTLIASCNLPDNAMGLYVAAGCDAKAVDLACSGCTGIIQVAGTLDLTGLSGTAPGGTAGAGFGPGISVSNGGVIYARGVNIATLDSNGAHPTTSVSVAAGGKMWLDGGLMTLGTNNWFGGAVSGTAELHIKNVRMVRGAGPATGTYGLMGSGLIDVGENVDTTDLAVPYSATTGLREYTVRLARQSTDNAAVVLTRVGGTAAPNGGTRLMIIAGNSYAMDADFTAHCTAGTDIGGSAHWHQHVSIGNVGGTVALVGAHGAINLDATLAWEHAAWTPISATGDDAGLLAMTLVPTADDANDAIAWTFTGHTGAAANTWVIEGVVKVVQK